MKASCQACARSYSVSDERIAERTGRFRCKCGALVRVDGRAISRLDHARWAVLVGATDRRWLTLEEMLSSWVSGLVPGDALVQLGADTVPRKLRDLPEVRTRLALRRAASPRASSPSAVGDDPYALPLVRRKRTASVTPLSVNELTAFAHGVDAALAPPWHGQVETGPLAGPSSARNLTEALTRYAERSRTPDSSRVESLAPASLPARGVAEEPRSRTNLLVFGVAAIVLGAVAFLWRIGQADPPTANAAMPADSFSTRPATSGPALAVSPCTPCPASSVRPVDRQLPILRKR